MRKISPVMFIAYFVMAAFVQVAKGETINCGLKTIDVQNGNIVQMRHEDGTTYSGSSVSDNWDYDGKTIKHKLLAERIPCGSKPKSRDEVVAELSSRFIENPSLHGMNKQEALWMASYTANLMNTDKNCHLLVDASKSTQRNETFFIDCNDQLGNSHRYWVPRDDLKNGNTTQKATAVSEAKAINICNAELRLRAANPVSYNPALLTGTSSRIVKANGRNIVEIDFSAKSAIGVEGKFRGRCILESGRLIDATVDHR